MNQVSQSSPNFKRGKEDEENLMNSSINHGELTELSVSLQHSEGHLRKPSMGYLCPRALQAAGKTELTGRLNRELIVALALGRRGRKRQG